MNSNELAVLIPNVEPKRPALADLTGLIASIGCAIHCAAMPLVIGYLPMLGLDWVATQGFHQAMAVICAGIAIAAFFPGWRRHQKLLPAALGLIGIALITSHAFGAENCCGPTSSCAEEACQLCAEDSCSAAAVVEQSGTGLSSTDSSSTLNEPDATFSSRFARWVTPLGGFFLIGAHLVNHRLSCRCCLGEQPCAEESA